MKNDGFKHPKKKNITLRYEVKGIWYDFPMIAMIYIQVV